MTDNLTPHFLPNLTTIKGVFAAASLTLLTMSHAAEPKATPMPDLKILQQQVIAAEKAFAKSMAERNFAQFTSFIADEAIFYGGPQPLRGKEQVAAGWKGFFDGPQAPFSWEPENVDVVASGTLAHSSGPVKNAKGEVIVQYNSVWRQEAPGVWKVVFDKGTPVCKECATKAQN